MSVSYFRCPVEDHGDVLLGVFSWHNFDSAVVTADSDQPGAYVIKLCTGSTKLKDQTRVPLTPVDEAEIPEDKRLTLEGVLIEAGYPWGGSFIEALEGSVDELELECYQDPFKEGSDSYGMLVSRDGALWEVVPVMDERAEYAEENPDDWETVDEMDGKIGAACKEHGVLWLDTDWKHFEIDLTEFEVLGLNATRIEPEVIEKPEGVEISRTRLLDHKGYVRINVLFSPTVS